MRASSVTPEVALHLRQQGRLAKGGEPGQLALVAGDLPAERLGDKAVGEPEAAVGTLSSEPAIVAVEVGERAVAEQVVAVRDLIAGSVRRVDQRLVPIGEKQRRQGVAEMVVREEHPRLRPQPEIGDKTGGVEDVGSGAAPVLAEHDVHLANFLAPGETPQTLAQPLSRVPMGEVAAQKIGARADDRIDIAPLDRSDAQHLRERLLGKAARALHPVQPLFGHGSEDLVVVEQCRGRIVGAVVQAEDQHPDKGLALAGV